jgi:hypothetical protein
MSRADDGARPVLVGGAGEDSGITTHGVTRASMLRPGQQIRGPASGLWRTIETVAQGNGKVIVRSSHTTSHFAAAEIVPVRDILHTYTDDESATA